MGIPSCHGNNSQGARHLPVDRISQGENSMNQLTQTLASVVASALFATSVVAQSTVFNVESEPAPSLTVQPPLPGPLAQGVAYIPYRLENLRIVPVGGAAARE